MANLKIRYFITILLLTATATTAIALQYESTEIDKTALGNLETIPLQIGEWWQGKDFPLDEMVYEILETRAIIHRSFTGSDGKEIFLSIVHYSDTKVDFHAPEACLGGEGLQTKKSSKSLFFQYDNREITLDVAEIISKKNTGNETLSYYFYKSGDFIGSNYIKMRLSIAANKLFRNDTRGSLIRISTPIISTKQADAETMLTNFLHDFIPYVYESL